MTAEIHNEESDNEIFHDYDPKFTSIGRVRSKITFIKVDKMHNRINKMDNV